MGEERKPVDAAAVSIMVLLCLIWGVGHVAAKLTAPGISLVYQSGARCVIATLMLLAWARYKRVPLWNRDGTLWVGLLTGVLFAAEFVFIFAGLARTDAARMSVFVYLTPAITAVALHFLIPQERLNARQWLGILLAFAGIALAFGDSFSNGRGTLLGDFFGVVAAVFWAGTTLLIRTSRLASADANKTLFYQLGVAGPFLLGVSWLMGEPGVVHLTPLVVAAFAYQCVAVAFASFLTWFWLLRRYLAARLSVLTFLTPLFGMLAGSLVLGEPLTSMFVGAALLVGAGIVLVNLKS